jgi:N utilization substance protein B
VAGTRRKSREIALQVLYEIDVTRHNVEKVLNRVLSDSKIGEENKTFIRELVEGVMRNKEEIDKRISEYAPSWPVEQISVIDRNILRLAIFEILLDNKVPVRASINEAVELAKNYGSESSSRFINGVLGSISTLAHR